MPKLYELTSIFWVGRISLDALSIAEQFEFVSVSMEVVNETAICGVLALVAWRPHDPAHVARVVRLGLLIALAGSCALTLTVLLSVEHFVRTIGTPPAIAALTRRYLALRSLALPLDAASLVLLVAIKALGRGRDVLRLVTWGVIMTAVLDLVLVSNTPISLRLGIPGLAVGQVLGKLGLLLLVGFRFIALGGRDNGEMPSGLVKPFFAVGAWTGIDSLVRNFGYLGLLSLLNETGKDSFGGYGLAMTVMWTVLVPVLALGEGTSVVVAQLFGARNFHHLARVVATSAALALAYMTLVVLVGGVLLRHALALLSLNLVLTDYAARTLRWLIAPYLCLALSICIKSLFFGTGRTRYILLLSLLTNGILIVPFVLLTRAHRIAALYGEVIGLISIVMAADLLLTITFAVHLLRRIQR